MNPIQQLEDFYQTKGIQAISRKQAIKDGLLIDVSKIAKEAEIPYPVALTAKVYHEHVSRRAGNPRLEIGPIWGIVYCLWVEIQKKEGSSDPFLFFKIVGRNYQEDRKVITFKAVCRPGDNQEPVITVMMPDEE